MRTSIYSQRTPVDQCHDVNVITKKYATVTGGEEEEGDYVTHDDVTIVHAP